MTNRSRTMLAAVALLALAACQGGGNVSSPVPVMNNVASTTMGSADYVAVPKTAANGIRTYIHLPLRNTTELENLIQQQSTPGTPLYQHWLTPAQFRTSYGPAIQDLKTAAASLQGYGFTTTITSQGIFADAPQATVERTFGIHLRRAQSVSAGSMGPLVADRAPTMPTALAKLNAQITSVGSAHPFMPEVYRANTKEIPENRYGPTGPYWFDDLKQAYTYPSYLEIHGVGKTIGIVSTSDFLDGDYKTYFSHEKLASPSVIRRPVSGGPPPFNPNSSDSAEVTVDIQQAGGSAPGATLVLYGAPDDSDSSFFAMYVAIDEDNAVDIVNTSFGSCELFYTAPYNGGTSMLGILTAYHQLFLQGNAQGITFVASSGDFGAYGCWNPSLTQAILGVTPSASDPAVTAVGGTNLVTSYYPGYLRSTYHSENAFDDKFAPGQGPFGAAGNIFGSGGGKSVVFAKPPYQTLVNTRASVRTIPDVALHMGGCPAGAVTPCGPDRSFDVAVFDGQLTGFLGTSLSSPEFAGLQALQGESLGGGRQGNVNYLIYNLAKAESLGGKPIFHNTTPGNNGYPSIAGYDYITGNGEPYGTVYAFRPNGNVAGNPQAPSNP